MNAYIESHKDRFGVEPICDALQVAPSSYYSARNRPVCARRRRDEELKPAIRRVFDANYQVYGARKVWKQLNRQGVAIPRCRTERLMRQLGLVGRVGARRSAPPSPIRSRLDPPIWSNASSRPPPRTSCGWPT